MISVEACWTAARRRPPPRGRSAAEDPRLARLLAPAHRGRAPVAPGRVDGGRASSTATAGEQTAAYPPPASPRAEGSSRRLRTPTAGPRGLRPGPSSPCSMQAWHTGTMRRATPRSRFSRRSEAPPALAPSARRARRGQPLVLPFAFSPAMPCRLPSRHSFQPHTPARSKGAAVAAVSPPEGEEEVPGRVDPPEPRGARLGQEGKKTTRRGVSRRSSTKLY